MQALLALMGTARANRARVQHVCETCSLKWDVRMCVLALSMCHKSGPPVHGVRNERGGITHVDTLRAAGGVAENG